MNRYLVVNRNSFGEKIIVLLVFLFIQNFVIADVKIIKSPEYKVSLLELYTSQGCSSCPPAESWLSKFKTDTNLWTSIIPINFHVDYWDYIGWKDPFADARFSNRQRWYEYLGLSKNVATPGFIINGKGWNGWFYGQAPSIERKATSSILTARIDGDKVSVEFLSNEHVGDSLNVHVAIMGFDMKTKVTSGENNRKTLMHDFVVLGYDTHYLTQQGKRFKSRLTLPDVSKYRDSQKGIVIWVSPRKSPKPIQAAGDWIDI